MGLKITKGIWDKLRSVYKGDLQSKKSKLTNLKHKFENLRMFDDEIIERYIHRVNEVVNYIKGVGGKIEESDVVRKVLQTLLKSHKPKSFAIEESNDIDKYTLDKLLGSLSTFEIVKMDKR